MIRIRAVGTSEIGIGRQRVQPDSEVFFGLLLYLGLNAGERIPRERVLDLLWPGRAPSGRGRHALRQLLYRLRRAGVTLGREDGELMLGTELVESDLAAVLAPDWPERAADADIITVSEVLPGYVPPESEAFREWLDALRARVGAQYRRAVILRMNAARLEGRWGTVDEWARRCLAIDPLNEEATLAWAEATAMTGAKARALDILDTYLRELGDKARVIGLPARVLRRRISEQVTNPAQVAIADSLFVGRVGEIAHLSKLLQLSIEGNGSATVIKGAAGLGKSRLASELVLHALLRGCATVRVKLFAGHSHRPLGVVADLVEQMIALPGALGCDPDALAELRKLTERTATPRPAPETSVEAEVVQDRLFRAFLELVTAVLDENSLVVLIDDSHFMDEASARTLARLARWSEKNKILWLLTERTPTTPTLDSRDAFSDSISVIDLEPLGADAVEQMVSRAADPLTGTERAVLVKRIVDISNGNPLSVQELCRQWVETRSLERLPQSLAAALSERISRLGASSAIALQACALLGSQATAMRVSRVVGRSHQDLLQDFVELDTLGILDTPHSDRGLRLHDLWREEVARALGPATKQMLHARIAAVLDEDSAASGSPTLGWEAAQHYASSGEPERGRALLERWGTYLSSLGFPVEAADCLERALRYCYSEAERLRIMRGRVQELHRGGQWDALSRCIEPTVRLEAKLNPHLDDRGDLELLSIESQWRTMRDPRIAFDRAVGFAKAGFLSKSRRLQSLVLVAMIADSLSEWQSLQWAHEEMQRLCPPDSDRDVDALSVELIYQASMGDLTRATNAGDVLVEYQRSRGSIRGLSRALRNSAYPRRLLGEFKAAQRSVEESVAIAEQHHLVGEAASSCDVLACIHHEAGNDRAASACLEHASGWAEMIDAPIPRFSLRILAAQIGLARGEPNVALSAFSESPLYYRSDPITRQGLGPLCALAGAYRLTGQMECLATVIPLINEMVVRSVCAGRHDFFVIQYVEGLAALGRTSEASAFAAQYLRHQRRERTPAPAELIQRILSTEP